MIADVTREEFTALTQEIVVTRHILEQTHRNGDDLGPEAWLGLDPGASDGGGGEIVSAGTPEHIAAEKRSYTGQFLKPLLTRGAASKRKKRIEAAE